MGLGPCLWSKAMKKILFPALAAVMLVASPAAFAHASGDWFVLADSNTHACFAANRTATGGEETLSGPYASQAKAMSAVGGLVQCGGQFGSDN
jgi:hypothetical protein